jgi:hypothetical protein
MSCSRGNAQAEAGDELFSLRRAARDARERRQGLEAAAAEAEEAVASAERQLA